MSTYFKIFVHHESFDSHLQPAGLLSLVDESTYKHVMSFSNVVGVHHFVYGSFKIDLVVKPLKSQNHEKEKNSFVG